MKKKLKLVEVVKQFLVQWMPKHIKTTIIHKLGGYTVYDYITYGNKRYIDGVKDNNHNNKKYLQHIEFIAYGKSKQEWIDLIHDAIKHL